MGLLLRIAGNAMAAWFTVWFVPGLSFTGDWWWFAVFGLVIGLVNAYIKPATKMLTLPLRILTLGLFTVVVNVTLMVVLIWVAQAADIGFNSDSLLATLLGGLALTVSASILNRFVE
ncbi:MAG: phage holin family protein [Acidobacteria bacterium]|nr:phage holin family protein [Acidobacteriota bacterium]